ncbi:Copia protein [Ceratocystis lukuohia]|uniref:Copia protein n=1 Tax=Ceratocystis lukuohia TaxID=2019550 RepID=A0ABR4MGA1_9PEZI
MKKYETQQKALQTITDFIDQTVSGNLGMVLLTEKHTAKDQIAALHNRFKHREFDKLGLSQFNITIISTVFEAAESMTLVPMSMSQTRMGFTDTRKVHSEQLAAGSQKVEIEAYGEVVLPISGPKETEYIKLTNVAYVPDFLTNLVSNKSLKSRGVYLNTRTCHKLGCILPLDQADFVLSQDFDLYIEDRFARAAKSKSIVNVASKIYPRIHIKDPGEYEVTLTYHNGETTVANWVARPISSDRKAKSVILFIGDGITANARMEVNPNRDKEKMWLSQKQYIKKMSEEFDITTPQAKPVSTPIAAWETLEPIREEEKSVNKKIYQSLIGTLILLRRGGMEEPLIEYPDADYANSKDRKSVSGMVFALAGGPIKWKAQKQRSVAISTTEAELRANTLIYGDNQAAIKIANNLGASDKTKHIDIQHHAVKDWIQQGKVKLEYVATEDMLADGFTKPLNNVKFNKFRSQMHIGIPSESE